ncbi:TIGR04552 family protein [bacterium]|nr:TIGR04552 family protein [bacterium]
MSQENIETFYSKLSIKDKEIIKSVLSGESILDWHRVHFKTEVEVISFLKLNEFDIESPRDLRRLNFIYQNAVDYLKQIYDIHIPGYFQKNGVIGLFLLASSKEISEDTKKACIILKVMNIISHIDSQDLINRVSIQHTTLMEKVKEKVAFHIQKMRDEGFPEFKFEWSFKERNSIISKFLSKKEGIVARIFDRIRFRIITKSREEIIPILHYFFSHLFPYNYVIPNETKNNLIYISELEQNSNNGDQINTPYGDNEFSGPSYRVLNFIVDIPIRIDDLLVLPDNRSFANYAYFIYMLAEVQIIDEKTAENNEKGENAHHLYKERQKESILKRLDSELYDVYKEKRNIEDK